MTPGAKTYTAKATGYKQTGWNTKADGTGTQVTICADTDNTDVGELMKCFLQKEIDNDKFPELSDRLSYFKNDGGVDYMCDIIKNYAKEYAEEEKAEMLVEIIENIAKSTGSIDEACEIAKNRANSMKMLKHY